MSATTNLPTLSLEAAKIASEAAQAKAKEMGIGMSMEPHSPLSSSIVQIRKDLKTIV